MANSFADLPLPVLNGPGAAVDVSTFGFAKTLTCVGTFEQATITIEASVDGGVEWAPVHVFQMGTPDTVLVEVVANRMRTNVSGRKAIVPFAVNCDVAAPAATPLFANAPLPAGNGAGTPVDISTFGAFTTFIVGGTFGGAVVTIQISEDGVDYATLKQFAGQGGIFSHVVTANWVRAFVAGRKAVVPFSATLDLGATELGGGGGGASQSFRYVATGAEGSDFFVTLPVAEPDDLYAVDIQLAGVTFIVGVDAPDIAAGDRTTTQFRVVTTFPLTAGDQLDILINEQ